MVKNEQARFVPREQAGWYGVEREGYVPGEVTNVVRHTLVGGRKDEPSAAGPTLEVRYFEVPPGAVTRLEKHEHEHFVIVGAGTGHAIVGESVREVKQHDVVYVRRWSRISSSIAEPRRSAFSASSRPRAISRSKSRAPKLDSFDGVAGRRLCRSPWCPASAIRSSGVTRKRTGVASGQGS